MHNHELANKPLTQIGWRFYMAYTTEANICFLDLLLLKIETRLWPEG